MFKYFRLLYGFFFVGDPTQNENDCDLKFGIKISRRRYHHIDLRICADEFQPLITEFLMNCSRDQLIIKQLINNNKAFRDELEARKVRDRFNQPKFLQSLLAQSAGGKRLPRYDQYMKDVSLYLFMTAGHMAYETLQKNLPLPSIATVVRHLGKETPMREGASQIDSIKQEILQRGLPLYVWASEDDTKIQSRIRYNIDDDTILGLQLPLDTNGIPIQSFYKFTTIEVMETIINSTEDFTFARQKTQKKVFVADSLPSDENSPRGFIKFIRDDVPYFVRKSSLLWMMTTNKEKVSSDRLYRFISTKKSHSFEEQSIQLGDFIIMSVNGEETICQVIGFRYITGSYKFKAVSCPIKSEAGKGIEVLVFQFKSMANGILAIQRKRDCYINIDNYIKHISLKRHNKIGNYMLIN